ncbi:MAG: glycine zipper 2TM domain-containing protein [Thiomonas arsenitoxydans]|nr:glycine zipper 2TM domain-containing protein [Thiomonas arsenitoxydans]
MSSIPPQGPATSGKGVWIAVFVMGAVIVALLAAVLYKMSQSPANPAAHGVAAASAAATPAQLASAAQKASTPAAITAVTAATPAVVATPQPAGQVVQSQAAPTPVRQPVAPRPAPAPQPAPVAQNNMAPQQFSPQPNPVQAAPQQPVCNTCGTVIAVTPQQMQSQQNNPVGIIAGGIVGGLLGNQVGGGDGRKLATVAGAIGGGLAGNEIAKRVDAQTVYDVQVRMENGQVRNLQLKVAPPVGQRVQIGADGGLNPIQ